MTKFFLRLLICALIFLSCKKTDNKLSDKDKIIDQPQLSPVDTIGAMHGDWIISRIAADPDKLNPVYSFSSTGTYISSFIFESLNNQDNITYELLPGVASLPEISNDQLFYTYEINKNAKFSDGVPLTGEDVIFTVKTIKNPFSDAVSIRKIFDEIEKVEPVNGDLYKIKFTVSKQSYYHKRLLSLFRIIPKHVLDGDGLSDRIEWKELTDEKAAEKNPSIKKFAEMMNRQEVSRDPGYLIGSGPYSLEKWEIGQSITIKRNDNYWNKSVIPSYADKIIWKIIPDNSASLVAVKNKEIDVLSVSPTQFYNELGNPRDFSLKTATVPSISYQLVSWNLLNPLFNDKKVRLALAYLFDRKNIIDKILYDKAILVQSHIFYADKKNLNSELPEINFDPAKGKKLLEEAGWKDSDGDGIIDKIIDGKKIDFKFNLLYPSGGFNKQIMIVYAEELKKAGIYMDIVSLEFAVFIQKISNHEFDACYRGWFFQNPFPNPYPVFHSSQTEPGGRNSGSFINSESDSLLELYDKEFDESKRVEIIKKWQKLIYDEQPYLFLWTPIDIYIYDDRFKNSRWYNLLGSAQLNEWWVPKEMQKYK